ncbi:hypothetical protein BAUCODRAFT_63054 [Baudoinia panamericana UAMH 10762]|uniref:N-acetylglucosamine-induced protein 1 n=1 Tax=Baudoinia panamericana (strain UAMH 10762) TaxID=717646 RepID=M2LYQ0_BAUPA|nr:uncharacterized protein BAUCODRAFT_63054 [Baudoinia panamericana UAMH 10762]EMC99832.1 hypothetical protein BAUCODRAFT_63054 [Baudoinia panamericana UAMH 10762]
MPYVTKGVTTTETTSNDPTAFWNVNLPVDQKTAECPGYLQYAFGDEKERAVLSTPDHLFHRLTWPEVQQVIRDNRLDLFLRLGSQLHLYRKYCVELVQQYGSVMNFAMQERLQWTDLNPKAAPFENPSDYRILYNDWPYGVDHRIVHLVVWTKYVFPSDPSTTDLTPQARRQINDFVDEVFVSNCGREDVIWFRNWAALKSIHAVEHFHVMLYDPDPEFVRGVTGGDVALAEKVKADDGADGLRSLESRRH